MPFEPTDYKWELGVQASAEFNDLRAVYGEGWYSEQKKAFQKFLCNYIRSTNGQCNAPQGKSIRPCGGPRGDGTALKVRWVVPGGGKSGGLRLGVVVTGDRIYIATANRRNTDPSESEIFGAIR